MFVCCVDWFRPSAQDLLKHPFMKAAKRTDALNKLLESRRAAEVSAPRATQYASNMRSLWIDTDSSTYHVLCGGFQNIEQANYRVVCINMIVHTVPQRFFFFVGPISCCASCSATYWAGPISWYTCWSLICYNSTCRSATFVLLGQYRVVHPVP